MTTLDELLAAEETQKRRQMEHTEPQRHNVKRLPEYGKQAGLGWVAGIPGYVSELANLVRSGPGMPMTSPMRRIKQDAPQTTEWFGEKMGADVSSPAFTLGSIGSPDAGDVARLGVIAGHVSPTLAKMLSYKTKIPDEDVFRAAVANTPGAELVDDGLIMRTVRRQQPDQEGALAVRGGVFYLPEKSKYLRYYTGKGGYGGSEKFAGETMVRAPLVVKGATGGKAPERAFDLINGKGAYEKMRREALNALQSTVYGQETKLALIERFLDEYAPEMSSHAHEIIRNSQKGNTLAYALQEAAVAHAVRQAGYDSVLGYSMKRTGEPFLSELFDVRELTYPAHNIEPKIHEIFE